MGTASFTVRQPVGRARKRPHRKTSRLVRVTYSGEEAAPRAADRGSGVKSELVLLVLLCFITFSSFAEACLAGLDVSHYNVQRFCHTREAHLTFRNEFRPFLSHTVSEKGSDLATFHRLGSSNLGYTSFIVCFFFYNFSRVMMFKDISFCCTQFNSSPIQPRAL